MTPRFALRLVTCAALAATWACAGGVAPSPARPNEVQVVEPAGRPDDWTYAPKELAVARGMTVTFVNRGKEFHTVTSDDAGRPFDVSIGTNQTGTITFEKVGTFAYHCGVHPQMKGVVRVCDGPCG
ncbi:MAG TPA: cupredoxin domain-containing protein [Candidatus Limnocylindria bacterium]|nr:cupredoxin domain-containing protein [Candidatus Limnocylindria bacterium]